MLRPCLIGLLAITSIFSSSSSLALETTVEKMPIIDYSTRFLPVVAAHGMVAGPEQLATIVGRDILEQGGNAVDAAVATGFALAVTYPRAGNIGGGGFMLLHLAEDNKQTFIDYRETAPAAATRDMFINEAGEVDKRKEYFSRQSAGVPGTVAGLLYALEKYGTMSREQVLAPAIALARDGMTMTYSLRGDLSARAKRLQLDPISKGLFYKPDGSLYAVGENWKQPDLAWTLQQISDRGRDGFYKGEVAKRIAKDMQTHDGLITEKDLANYKAVERKPVQGSYKDFQIFSAPPPSSGGTHIIQMLNMLEGFDLKSMGHNSAAYIHHLTESMKLAYADRSEYLGDPDYVDTPVAKLIDKDYAKRLRTRINPEKATPAKDIAPGKDLAFESTDTTHYTIVDKQGNVVSNTYTLNFSFGAHVAVAGTGMLLNNEMADFAAKPGTANAFGLVQGERNKIEGGKRPLSSMSPTIVFRDGKPWLASGSPGGSIIITAVLQTILNAMEFDWNVATAASASRIHHQWHPDQLRLENGISQDTMNLLESMGHSIQPATRTLGRTQSIMIEDGLLYGATDPRRPGGWVAGY